MFQCMYISKRSFKVFSFFSCLRTRFHTGTHMMNAIYIIAMLVSFCSIKLYKRYSSMLRVLLRKCFIHASLHLLPSLSQCKSHTKDYYTTTISSMFIGPIRLIVTPVTQCIQDTLKIYKNA